MRRSLVLTPLLLSVVCAAACGGTASETPWPHEPEDVNLGPAGEAARSGDDASRPKKGDGAAPASSSTPSGTRADPVAP